MKSLALASVLVLIVIAGCQDNGSSNTPAPNAPTPVQPGTATPSNPNSTRLKEGTAPLSYIMGPGGQIRIIDVTDKKELVKTTAPLQAVILIDETKGISVANQTLKPGPLPPGHRYEIWHDR